MFRQPQQTSSGQPDYGYRYEAPKPEPYTAAAPAPVNSETTPVYRWITLYAAITAVPLTATSIILLYLVLAHRIASGESDVFLVDFDLSAILTVSSWAATVAVLLPGLIMAMYSYVAARQVLQASISTPPAYHQLPTPHQYALSTAILEFGGLASLWRFLLNVYPKSAPPVPGYLKRAAGVLLTAVLFGWLITAADTWLHASSSTILSAELTAVPSSAHASYGRRISSSCDDMTDARDCTLNAGGMTTFLMNDVESTRTMTNISTNNKVYTVGTTSILLSASLSQAIDFTTTTFGLRTTCKPISSACGLPAHTCTRCWEFDCGSAGFPLAKGDLYNVNQRYFFAGDSSRNKSVIFGADINPLPFVAGMFQSSVSRELWGDPEIPSDQQKVALLSCEADILDIVVSSTNGTLSIDKSDLSTNKVLVLTMTGTTAADTYWADALRQGFQVAGTETTVQALADSFAGSFSRTFVGLVAGSTEPVANSVQHNRRTRLLARIPLAPFWVLIVLSVGAVLLAASVAAMAMGNALGNVAGIGQTKIRMSPEGLAALAFEDTRGTNGVSEHSKLFAEHSSAGGRRKVVLVQNAVGGVDVLRHGM